MTGKNSLRHFWRKYRLSLLGVAVILGFIFLSGTFLSTQEQVHGKNPLETENKESSRIAVTGKNYTLNYKQEEEYKREQAKREEKIKQQPAEPIEEIKIPSATEIRRKKDRENRKQAEETKRETAKVKAVRIQGAMRKYPNFLRLYAA